MPWVALTVEEGTGLYYDERWTKQCLIWLLPQEGRECHSGHFTFIQHQQLHVLPAPLSSPPCWGIQQILISLLASVLQPGLQAHKGQGFKLNVRTTSSPDPHLHMNTHKEMMVLKEGWVQMREWWNTEQSVPAIFESQTAPPPPLFFFF